MKILGSLSGTVKEPRKVVGAWVYDAGGYRHVLLVPIKRLVITLIKHVGVHHLGHGAGSLALIHHLLLVEAHLPWELALHAAEAAQHLVGILHSHLGVEVVEHVWLSVGPLHTHEHAHLVMGIHPCAPPSL